VGGSDWGGESNNGETVFRTLVEAVTHVVAAEQSAQLCEAGW